MMASSYDDYENEGTVSKSQSIPNFVPPEKQQDKKNEEVFEILLPEELAKVKPVKSGDDNIIDITPIDDGLKSKIHEGVLVDHGHAKYNFDDKADPSYYVKYLDSKGYSRTIWGVDLERVIEESQAKHGQHVKFENMGRQLVTVQVDVKDDQGTVIGTEPREVHKNVWNIEVLSKEQAQTARKDKSLLMDIVDDVNKSPAPSEKQRLNSEELKRAQDTLSQKDPIHNQTPGGIIPGTMTTQQTMQPRGGGQAIGEGLTNLVTGAASLTGTLISEGAKGLTSMATAIKEGLTSEGAPAAVHSDGLAGANVLPRLSEYRVQQLENASNAYDLANQELWKVDKLALIRQEIEERARLTGVSVSDVMDKMKPNGEFSDLHKKFTEAVSSSPEAQNSKRSMDKALDTWVRQYSRSQEELLNPAHDPAMKDRVERTKDKMSASTLNTPVVGDEQSHYAKLHEAIAKIMERLKEVAKDFIAAMRGKGNTKETGNDAPSPM